MLSLYLASCVLSTLPLARCCQYDAAGPPSHLSLVVSGGVDMGDDEEKFMTRSLNVTPKTTEQRI